MKIPTTPPGGTPYYHGPPVNGMEMNPPWQGNGVMVEGGGPGNGATYMMPHHVHPAGYGAPQGYYGPGVSPPAPPAGAAAPQDFSEYMWMANEEEFDKEVMQQLEEEALMEQCIEAMLADEREAQNNQRGEVNLEEAVFKSTLNPLAAEFVPTFGPPVTDPEVQPVESSTPDIQSIEPAFSELTVSAQSECPAEPSKEETEEPLTDEAKLTMADLLKKPEQEAKKQPKVTDTIVVVSAKDVVKTARSEERKKSEGKNEKKHEVVAKTKSSEGKSKPKESVKETKKVEKAAEPVKPKAVEPKPAAKPAVVPKLKEEPKPSRPRSVDETPLDLQGPPLPTVAAVVTPEPEKQSIPAAPAVFNYAAAARANLPPKPAGAAATPAPAPPAPPPRPESVPKEQPAKAPSATRSVPAKVPQPSKDTKAKPAAVRKGKK